MRLLLQQYELIALFAAASVSFASGAIEVVLPPGGNHCNCEASGVCDTDPNESLYFHDDYCEVELELGGGLFVRDRDWSEDIWHSSFVQQPMEGFCLAMQDDGNLVIRRTSNNEAIWSTNTEGHSDENVFLAIHEDCRLSLLNGDPTDPENAEEIWTNIKNGLKAGDKLKKGEVAHDAKSGVFWILEHDGNLVAYDEEIPDDDNIGTGGIVNCGDDFSKLWYCLNTSGSEVTNAVTLWSSETVGTLTDEDYGWLFVTESYRLKLFKKNGSNKTAYWMSSDLCNPTVSLDFTSEPTILC